MSSAHDRPSASSCLRVPVAVSTTHVHLTCAAIEALFSDNYRLHEHSALAQPTHYAAEEYVTLIGPRGRLPNVPIIGPPRSANQVEISQADARTLGISAPVHRSGDVDGTPGILLKGPRTSVKLERGVICPSRHVHMTPTDAESVELKDGDRIAAVIDTHDPPALLHDVLVCVSADCKLELHLNTDEANASGLHSGDCVLLFRRSQSAGETRHEHLPGTFIVAQS